MAAVAAKVLLKVKLGPTMTTASLVVEDAMPSKKHGSK